MHVTSPGYLFDVKVHLYLFLKKDQGEDQHGQKKLSLNKKMKLKGIGAIRSGSKRTYYSMERRGSSIQFEA